MKIEYIILIIFAVIYFVTLIIVGVMAFIYYRNHKSFLLMKESFFEKWLEYKKDFDLNNVKPKEIKFELPIGEKVYELDEVKFIKSSKSIDLKELDKLARIKAEKIDDYFDDSNDAFILKSAYRLNNQKIREITFKGMMYITNKRIIFSNDEMQEQILFSKFEKSYASIINLGKNSFYEGLIVHVNGAMYEIISDKLSLSIIINQLVKESRVKKGK